MRVVSWNVQHLSVYTEIEIPAETHFAETVSQLEPDLLLLQEVDEFNSRSGNISHTNLAAEVLGAVDSRFVATPVAAGNYGIAIVSKIPVLSWHELRLNRSPIGQRLTFLEEGRPRRYYVADHDRAAVAAVLKNGWTVVNTHCSFVPGVAQWHARKAWRWGKAIARESGTQLVFGGDLNQQRFHARGAHSSVGDLTFPAWEPARQIDHLFTWPLTAASGFAAARSQISDHLPIAIDC